MPPLTTSVSGSDAPTSTISAPARSVTLPPPSAPKPWEKVLKLIQAAVWQVAALQLENGVGVPFDEPNPTYQALQNWPTGPFGMPYWPPLEASVGVSMPMIEPPALMVTAPPPLDQFGWANRPFGADK